MEPRLLYNSNEGRRARPRKKIRKVGQMPAHIQAELNTMSKFQQVSFKIVASMAILNLGVDIFNNYHHG